MAARPLGGEARPVDWEVGREVSTSENERFKFLPTSSKPILEKSAQFVRDVAPPFELFLLSGTPTEAERVRIGVCGARRSGVDGEEVVIDLDAAEGDFAEDTRERIRRVSSSRIFARTACSPSAASVFSETCARISSHKLLTSSDIDISEAGGASRTLAMSRRGCSLDGRELLWAGSRASTRRKSAPRRRVENRGIGSSGRS